LIAIREDPVSGMMGKHAMRPRQSDGFASAPASFKMQDGMYYNKMYPGHQIAMPQPDGARIIIPAESVDTFLITLNDFRLKRASEYGISEEMMDTHLADISNPDQRIACLEIHILGEMIAYLISLL